MQRVTHGIPLPLSVGVGPVPKGGLTRRSHPFGCGEDRCGRSCCASLAPCHHILEHEARHETFGTWTCDHAVNGRVHPQGKGLTGWLFQGDWLLFDQKNPSPPGDGKKKTTKATNSVFLVKISLNHKVAHLGGGGGLVIGWFVLKKCEGLVFGGVEVAPRGW